MKHFEKKIHIKRKRTWIFLSVLLVLLAVRIILPSIILSKTNSYLASFSPVISGHINDIDLSFLSLAGKAQGLSVTLKKTDKVVLRLKEAKASFSWRNLIKGKLLMDVVVMGGDVHYSNAVLEELKKLKELQKDEEKKEPPVHIDMVKIQDSIITMEDLKGFNPGKTLKIDKIYSTLTNLTPTADSPYTFFNFNASVQGDAPLKAVGKLNRLAKPIEWEIEGTLSSFDLNSANEFLKKKLPLSFTKGVLDVFAEATSKEGKVEGYVKPFFKNLDVVKNEENFKGPKHWAIEVITAISNLVVRNVDRKSVATKIPFKYDGKMDVDTGEALEKVIQHGFEERLKPGIENSYDLE